MSMLVNTYENLILSINRKSSPAPTLARRLRQSFSVGARAKHFSLILHSSLFILFTPLTAFAVLPLLVETDLVTLLARANEFEAQLGSDRQYRFDAVTNLVPDRGPLPADAFGQRLSASTLAYVLGEATRASEVLC